MVASPNPVDCGLAASQMLAEARDAARRDYNAFSEFVLRDNEDHPLRQAVLHRVWQAHILACWQGGKIPAILAPFGHGKSIQLTVGRTAWELGGDVRLRVKIVCQNDLKAMERVMGVASIFRSPRYRYVFPNVREVARSEARQKGRQAKWTQHEVFLDRPGFSIDPSIQAAGVLSPGTGGRADLMIFDDVVDQRNAVDEPALREKVVDNIDRVWTQRMEPHARMLYVGTPWHQADFTHKILERPAWCVLRQWVSEDFRRLEQEVYHPPAEYPLEAVSAAVQETVQATRVDSSNIREIAYDRVARVLEVRFVSGGRYHYYEVPQEAYAAFTVAISKGAYFAAEIRGKYAHKRVDAYAAAGDRRAWATSVPKPGARIDL